jgi:hypothetical protein
VLLDVPTSSPNATNDEPQILSVPIRLRRSGRELKMLITGADPFATAKPDGRLIKLLIRAHRFNAALVGSAGAPFAALAAREGVSRSYFTRLVRLSYLAPDITQAILDGRQSRDLRDRIDLLESFSTQRGADGPLRLSTAVGWNEQKGSTPAMNGSPTCSRAPSAR